MTNCLYGSMHRVVLNGQCSFRQLVQSGVVQGSVLGPLLFLTYINDLLGNVKFTYKIFADDTSLFSPVFNKNISRNELNTDLQSMSDWAYQWKMHFNLNLNKTGREGLLFKKS